MEYPGQEDLQRRLDQAEQALERSERMAIASRYASAIMHEVNNPLEAMTNVVYLTKLQRADPDQVHENMLILEQQLTALGRVTNQALTFHREQLEAKEVDLVEIAESALKLHEDKLRRHGVTVDRSFCGPAHACVFGSEILQVFSNLILNAVDAVPAGAGKLSIHVELHGEEVRITIADNGQGIADEVADKLFEPYLTTKTSGTGLGLWLSKRIITKHRGTLRFHTSCKEGRTGTSFHIALPVSRSATQAA
jgi:signal transduction histidine kinase